MTLTAVRDKLRDERIWCMAALVALHDDAGPDDEHFAYEENGQISISLRTLKHDIPIRAYLSGGTANVGVWFIPPIGTEVVVNFDNGEFEGDGYIVGVHGTPPTNLQAGQVLIRGTKVNICDATETGPTAEGVVVGRGVDPFTGQTYNTLGSSSSKVFAKK